MPHNSEPLTGNWIFLRCAVCGRGIRIRPETLIKFATDCRDHPCENATYVATCDPCGKTAPRNDQGLPVHQIGEPDPIYPPITVTLQEFFQGVREGRGEGEGAE